MLAKGLNLKSVKSENRSMILYLLNEFGALSRKEIANKLMLTPAGVTKICNELISEGYIYELGAVDSNGKSGRREVLLSLCLDDKLVFSINAEYNIITYSISDLKDKLIEAEKGKFHFDVDSVIVEAKEFLNKSSVDKSKIIATGVCIIGALDENDFGIWKEKNLKEKFENAIGTPVVVENNVKAFAQSELIYGRMKKSKSVLFLKWGPGIGSSVVSGGKVQSGNDSGIAEIGHYIVNVGGKKCRCGRFGCLETEASSDAIIKEAGGDLTLEEIANSSDKSIVYMLEHKIDLLALALVNTATILNAENIVLFGTLFNNERIAQKLIRQCVRYNPNFNEDIIRISSLNGKSDYIGGTAMCAKKYFFERFY